MFFFGIGASALLAALTRNAWQLAAALTLLGAFASIYHPVGIPMLVQNAPNPGAVDRRQRPGRQSGHRGGGAVTGFLVKWIGWRAAFARAGLLAIALRHAVLRVVLPAGDRGAGQARAARRSVTLTPALLARVFAVMTRGLGHRQPALQLHHQRQCAAADRALPRHRRGPGAARRAAGRGVRGRLVRAGGRRPADRPHAAEAAVPVDLAGAGAAAGAGRAARRTGGCWRAAGGDGVRSSARSRSPTR